MKRILSQRAFWGTLLFIAIFFASSVIAASPGNIDPNNTGAYKAAFLDSSVVSNTSINFGKFTTESSYDIAVSSSALDGYAWGSSVGWVVMNCADTNTGCTSTNGSFKVANDGNGNLSGYAWGENTGWINFGPFTNTSISRVKIDSSTGNFEGTQGSAGYAWSQNYGWIVFDCTNSNTCVNTSWRPAPTSSGATSGGGGTTSSSSTTSSSTTTTSTPTTTTSIPPSTTTTSTPPATSTSTETTNNSTTTTNTENNPASAPIEGFVGPTQQPPTAGGMVEPPNNPAQSTSESGPVQDIVKNVSEILVPITTVINSVSETVVPISQGVQHAAHATVSAARTPTGVAVTKSVTAAGVAATAVGGVAPLLITTPVGFSGLVSLLIRLWDLILIFLGLKKRRRPWGTVYDSVTKEPIDPAYVMLTDLQGNEVATAITDIDGRYGFSVPPGTYRLVANKTNYEFPSMKLAGRVSDELYDDLYFGDVVTITEEGGVIVKNIPMDQLNFDWNEFAKTEQSRLSYYKRSDLTIAHVSNFFFWVGFIFAVISIIAIQNTYNGVIFILYILILILRHSNLRTRAKGSITDMSTGLPMPFAIIHIISAATGQELVHKVTDRLGNYYCLVPNGVYKVIIDRKNPDASYTKFPIIEPVAVTKGYLKQAFKI